MNDHRPRRHDVVRPKGSSRYLTVNEVDESARLLHTTWVTGGEDIVVPESAVDVITPAGVA